MHGYARILTPTLARTRCELGVAIFHRCTGWLSKCRFFRSSILTAVEPFPSSSEGDSVKLCVFRCCLVISTPSSTPSSFPSSFPSFFPPPQQQQHHLKRAEQLQEIDPK